MIRVYLLIFLGLFCLLLGGCDAVYRFLDEEGAEEKELIGEVTPFEKNPTVEEIQRLLKIYGYSPGSVDGVLGLRTREAIEEFQKDNGLEPTRFADEETWTALVRLKTLGLVTDDGLNIVLIQQILIETGFNPGKADGKMGAKTVEAIKAFQKKHQLKPDGKIGYRTLNALSQYLVVTS
ncbi:MAG: peptidoglycan-binding protein [Candidatus Omnitrophica bacterium]|nr:peptidoglycan-binding protein [Candidatus Omnitrophota bacterium]